MSFFNKAQRVALLTGNYICPMCNHSIRTMGNGI